MNTDESKNNNEGKKDFISKIIDFLSKFKKKKEVETKEENEFSNYYGNSSSDYYGSSNYYSNSSDNYSSNSNYYDNNSQNSYYNNKSFNRDYNNVNSDTNIHNNQNSNNYYNNSNNYYGSSNDDYYSKMDNYDFNVNKDDEKKVDKNPLNKKKLFIAIGLAIILLIFIVLLFRGCLNSVKIELSDKTITLKVGENKYISYQILNTNDIIPATFSSSNPSIATVDDTGKVVGVSEGNTTIILSYKSGLSTKKEKCEVIVTSNGNKKNNNSSSNNGNNQNTNTNTNTNNNQNNNNTTTPSKPPTLSLSLANATVGSWSNKNSFVNISAYSNNSSSVSLKYAINCNSNSNCNYFNVSGSSITISNDGTSVVTVVATDNSTGLVTTKSITVQIDKKAPKVTLSPNMETISTVNKEIEVCAVCTDNESGCVETKTCKKYTSSASNQTITVKDKAGNTTSTNSFNVVINTTPPSCSLSLSGNTITATVSNATSYSFNSNFSSNTKTYTIPDLTSSDVQLNLNGSTTQQKTITYYVKNSSGTVKTCSINVSITCTCKYMYANICYKNQERGTYSSGSNACNGSNVWKSGDWCYKHLDPGYSCTFTRK